MSSTLGTWREPARVAANHAGGAQRWVLVVLAGMLLGLVAGGVALRVFILPAPAPSRASTSAGSSAAPIVTVPPEDRVAPVVTRQQHVLPVEAVPMQAELAEDGYPQVVPSRRQLREAIWTENYEEATRLIEGYRALLKDDWHYEDLFYQAMQAYETRGPEWADWYDAWVAQTPNHALPLLARATHWNNEGWSAYNRGRYDAAREYFDRSTADARKALSLDPDLTYPYALLIHNSLTVDGEYGDPRELYETGLAINPYSYMLRARYLQALESWQGGTEEARTAFVEEAQAVADLVPKVRLLRGREAFQKARQSFRNDDYPETIRYATEALRYGPQLMALRLRGTALKRLGRYEEAIADWKAQLNLDPLNQNIYLWLVEGLVTLGRDDEARVYYEQARESFGEDSKVVQQMAALL